jgi:SnoaL-like domain
MRFCRIAFAALLALFSLTADHARAETPSEESLNRVVADYVGLYRRETLDAWRGLFLPGFTAASTRPDGSVLVRTLDEFFGAQKRYLDSGRAIREVLENVRTERHGRLASVWADFVLTDEGETSRGRLVLTVIEEKGRFRIHTLMFSYE